MAQAVDETLEGFRLLQATGKVRFFGITGDDVAKLARLADTGLFDSVQTLRTIRSPIAWSLTNLCPPRPATPRG